FAHQVDQLVDFFHRDADRRGFGARWRVGLLFRFLAGGFLFLFFGRLDFGRRRILDAGLGADYFQRLGETVAARIVAAIRGVGADFLQRLEEAVALPALRHAGCRRGGAARRLRVEEAVAQLRFLALALIVFARCLGRRQRRQLTDLHLVGVDDKGADRDN